MPVFREYSGFLIVVDEWNNFVYTCPFKTKASKEIGQCFENILKNPALSRVCTISSDYGGEFQPLAKEFRKKGIKWLYLRSKQKAFLPAV